MKPKYSTNRIREVGDARGADTLDKLSGWEAHCQVSYVLVQERAQWDPGEGAVTRNRK